MADAIIARRNSRSGVSGNKVLSTVMITENGTFTAPGSINNTYYIRLFGGGGGGWMNNADIQLGKNSVIVVNIGNGGSAGKADGTTTFGTYLSANGGGAANSIKGGSGSSGRWGWQNGGDGYQFGGGGAYNNAGGNRGTWGGGGGSRKGGNGGTYGGGGGYGGRGQLEMIKVVVEDIMLMLVILVVLDI